MTKKQKCKKIKKLIAGAKELLPAFEANKSMGDTDAMHITIDSINFKLKKIKELVGKGFFKDALLVYVEQAFEDEGREWSMDTEIGFDKIFNNNTTIEKDMLVLRNVPETLYTRYIINFFNEDRSRLKKFGIKKVLINTDVRFVDVILEPWPDFIMISGNAIISRKQSSVSLLASLQEARRYGQIQDYRFEE